MSRSRTWSFATARGSVRVAPGELRIRRGVTRSVAEAGSALAAGRLPSALRDGGWGGIAALAAIVPAAGEWFLTGGGTAQATIGLLGLLTAVGGVAASIARERTTTLSYRAVEHVAFDGGESIDPQVGVEAVHQGEDIIVTVRVSGPAAKPEIDISSQPELPQDEILSRMLFGKQVTDLSGAQAAQLAAAVAELSGATGSGPGFMEKIRRGLGVDVLQFGGESGTSVRAGQYLSEDVFLGGAKRQPAALYLQGSAGRFRRSAATDSLWRADRVHEDVDAAFFDANGNGHLDLYVVSGGYAFSDTAPALQDRLYVNDGTGSFERSRERLPRLRQRMVRHRKRQAGNDHIA